ncbi:MAG: SgrR family transcriptional regulator [Paenibacillus sp.]|nr:SgrR family transcriptional regulator [Paenibacillus sp.]
MQLLEHYVRLYSNLKEGRSQLTLQEETEVTVSGIAAYLYCTERNAKLLIRAMRERGWIVWSPGHGRGNCSRLTLLADPGELLLEQAAALLAGGRIQETVELLNTPWLSGQWRERLLQALRESFGYHRSTNGNAPGHSHMLRFPSYRQPGFLDPALTTRRTELHFVRQLFDTLVEYDNELGMFLPGLAHHWETDRKAQCWRFYLQKHVRFHNEAPCTSEDVKHTLDRLRDPSQHSPYSRLYRGIRQVEVLDDYSLDIRLDSRHWHLTALLSSAASGIVPRDRPVSWSFLPSGTGPFRLSHRDNRLLVLEANPFYFRRAANVDRIEMWYLPEVYEQQFNNEDRQEGGGMNFRHYGGAQADHDSWELTVRADRGCKYVLLNRAKKGVMEQPALRNTLYKVIREGDAAGRLGGNRGELAYGFIRDLSPPHTADSSYAPTLGTSNEDRVITSGTVGWRHPDPSGLMKTAAGHPLFDQDAEADARHKACPPPGSNSGAAEPTPNRPASQTALQLITYAGAGHERDAAWLQLALEDYGIALSIRLVPYEALTEPDVLAQADLLLLEQPVDADAEWTMQAILGSGQSPLRRCLPADRLQELDRRLAELPNEPSRDARLQQLVRLEQQLLDDRTVICWYRWHQSASFPPALRGVRISSFGWVDYKQLWFAHDGDHEMNERSGL